MYSRQYLYTTLTFSLCCILNCVHIMFLDRIFNFGRSRFSSFLRICGYVTNGNLCSVTSYFVNIQSYFCCTIQKCLSTRDMPCQLNFKLQLRGARSFQHMVGVYLMGVYFLRVGIHTNLVYNARLLTQKGQVNESYTRCCTVIQEE